MSDLIFIEFVLERCYKCDILYKVSTSFQLHCQNFGDSFWCPNGHQQHYGETELQIAHERAKALQAKINEEQHARLVAEKAKRQAEVKLERLKKRAAAGVCPCCDRTFTNLSRHMKTKHKDFAIPGMGKRGQISGAIK